MKKLITKKGDGLLTFVIFSPFIVAFVMFFVGLFTFSASVSIFQSNTNSVFDRVLIEGQLTKNLKEELLTKLEANGFDRKYIEISSETSVLVDDIDSTYVKRGEPIEIQILYRKPHYFYYINKLLLNNVKEETFYIGHVPNGRSEKE